jgi:hypothetical protein
MRKPKSGERVIILGAREQHETIVSEEDFEFLTQWRWSFKISSWKYGHNAYARRHRRINGVRYTILLHDVILIERMGLPRPSELHTADHKNRDSLDNTRGNLEWATKKEQVANQKRRSRAALEGVAA